HRPTLVVLRRRDLTRWMVVSAMVVLSYECSNFVLLLLVNLLQDNFHLASFRVEDNDCDRLAVGPAVQLPPASLCQVRHRDRLQTVSLIRNQGDILRFSERTSADRQQCAHQDKTTTEHTSLRPANSGATDCLLHPYG